MQRLQGQRRSDRRGFTISELITTIVIGSILAGIVFRELAPVRSAVSIRSARASYEVLFAKARALSIEHGERVWVLTDPSGDSAWVRRGNTRVVTVDFAKEYGVDVQALYPSVLCMTPKGLADPDCGNIHIITETVFVKDGAWKGLKILPFGHTQRDDG